MISPVSHHTPIPPSQAATSSPKTAAAPVTQQPQHDSVELSAHAKAALSAAADPDHDGK